MDIIANHKGIILGIEDGVYFVEDCELNETSFDNLHKATSFWKQMVFQEMNF